MWSSGSSSVISIIVKIFVRRSAQTARFRPAKSEHTFCLKSAHMYFPVHSSSRVLQVWSEAEVEKSEWWAFSSPTRCCVTPSKKGSLSWLKHVVLLLVQLAMLTMPLLASGDMHHAHGRLLIQLMHGNNSSKNYNLLGGIGGGYPL